MNKIFDQLSASITTKDQLDKCFLHGLEKEALRITTEGKLSQTDHPKIFGNKLHNSFITTDYAESQLEFITRPYHNIDDAIAECRMLQSYTQKIIDDELLWPLSMPPDMKDPENEIRIAQYDNSTEGNEKEIYRKGLALRYGKTIQTVSGVHYNFSCTDVFWSTLLGKHDSKKMRDEKMMGLVRNFLRLRFLFVYAFGASPIVGKGYPHESLLDANYCPTSIRMSRYGYSNTKQRGLLVSYDSLDKYVQDLRQALKKPHPTYKKFGILHNDEQIQLNENILQIPAEYYSPIRIKPAHDPNSNLLESLQKNGIQRIELRALDLDPFSPCSINPLQLDLLLIAILYCLLSESPPLLTEERNHINGLQRTVALCGRCPDIRIHWKGSEMSPQEACQKLEHDFLLIAQWLDTVQESNRYSKSLEQYCTMIQNKKIVSMQMMKIMKEQSQTHQEFGLHFARKHKQEMESVSVSRELFHKLRSYANS